MVPGETAFMKPSVAFHILHRDRSFADGPLIFGRRSSGNQLIPITGEIFEILRRGPRRIAREAGEPVADVRRIADLAHLSIAHHVNAGFRLLPQCFEHARLDRLVEFHLIVGFLSILRKKVIDHLLRAGQAANVGGQDAIGTQFHFLRSLLLHI
jgi:hypothetical protein